jgi:carbonic anhydrase/acetyltransferase-like protein (isoleucine patch superfamily)
MSVRETTNMSDAALVGSVGGGVPSIHPLAWVAPGAVVVGRVTIGPASSIWYGAVLRADEDEISIGAECNIQDLCCIHVDSGEPAVIEDRVSVGHRATIHGARLETGCLVGIGAVVLGRATVGRGSLVAAGTVVPPGRLVPVGVLYAGVPGRVIRELTEADRDQFASSPDRYVQRAELHRQVRWADGAAGNGGPQSIACPHCHP